MQNKVVLFDIDHTLFNTDFYQKEGFAKIATLFPEKPTEDVILAAREVYTKIREVDVFHPYRFGQKLNEYLDGNVTPEKIAGIFEDKKFIASCVYEDVHPTLEALTQQEITLGIFSTGEKKLQMEKVDVIGHFFKEDDIHIYPLKDVEIPQILKQYEGKRVYIIDDISRVLEEVNKQDPKVITIWITRKGASYHDDADGDYKPNKNVQALPEVVSIVASN